MPGLAASVRGVALGSDLLVRLPTLERVVTFLRVVAAELTLPELGAHVVVLFARAEQGLREVMVRIAGAQPHAVDAVARAARAAGGQALTGSGRQFVLLRDAQAPLGYDIERPTTANADLVLYTLESERGLRIEGELSLADLVLRLELQREPVGTRLVLPDPVFLVARAGVGQALLPYLHRSGVRAEVATDEPAPGAPGERTILFRLHGLPARMHGLLRGTPGLTLYVPQSANLAVAVGYRHPLPLAALGEGVFSGDRLLLLRAPPAPPRVIEPAPSWVPIEALVQVARPAPAAAPIEPARAGAAALRVTPVVTRATSGRDTPDAVLVPWRQAAWLRQLCFALPASVLAGHRAAVLEDGLLIVASDGLAALPFGAYLRAIARGVYVPFGYALRPALSAALLEERLETAHGDVVLFDPQGRAARVDAARFEPLERHLLGRLQVEPAGADAARVQPAAPAADTEIRHAEMNAGFMPLWRVGGTPPGRG